jgi:hypothetical protein
VPEGYVDEAVVEKLQNGFGAAIDDECLPTGGEVMTAAARIMMLGLHVRLTRGDVSATTPAIQARLEAFGQQLRDLIEAAFREDDPDPLQ